MTLLLREAHRFWRGAMKIQVPPPPPPPSSGEYNRFLGVTADVYTRSFPTRRFELCDFQFLKILRKKPSKTWIKT